MIAAIQIRGLVNSKDKVKDTIRMLNMGRKHTMVILEDTPSNIGMLKKAKDYITWGELDPKLEKELDRVMHLHPPRGGFERKGIKKTFRQGGAQGHRGEKINDLIRKMLPNDDQ